MRWIEDPFQRAITLLGGERGQSGLADALTDHFENDEIYEPYRVNKWKNKGHEMPDVVAQAIEVMTGGAVLATQLKPSLKAHQQKVARHYQSQAREGVTTMIESQPLEGTPEPPLSGLLPDSTPTCPTLRGIIAKLRQLPNLPFLCFYADWNDEKNGFDLIPTDFGQRLQQAVADEDRTQLNALYQEAKAEHDADVRALNS
nr:hypothetical protein 7 [Saccharospirillaceae bacterium]